MPDRSEESLQTLSWIADWGSHHSNSAAAMQLYSVCGLSFGHSRKKGLNLKSSLSSRAGRLLALGAAVAISMLTVMPAQAASAAAVPFNAGAAAPSEDPPVPSEEVPAPGQACAPGFGVTVVVNFAPANQTVAVQCVPGVQPSYRAALEAAGFELGLKSFDFGDALCSINGVGYEADVCFTANAGSSWVSWINVQGGAPSGAFTDPWQVAQTGIDSGSLAIDTYIGFSQAVGADYPGAGPQVELPPVNDTVEPPVYGPAEGSALAAAGWIGRQVQAGGGLLNGSVGFTTDAIYALAAAGVGGDVIDQAAQRIFDSGTGYVGDADARATKSGAIAKTALALQIAGLDPTVFPAGNGTRDLIADLRDIQNEDGTFGTSANPYPFSQALPILALARTVSGAPESALTWLVSQQCADQASPEYGSFYGYYFEGAPPICETGDSDSTAMSVQALLAAGVPATDPAVVAAQSWLITAQAVDGGSGANTNSTGLAGQTLAVLGNADQAAAAAGYIGGLQFSCDTVNVADSAVVAENVGAISFDAAGFNDAIAFGIDDSNLGTIQYATVQAVFGLGTPAFGSLTAEGAEAGLPAVPDCTPAVPALFTLNVTSGAPGDVIPFAGSGFSAAETVTFTLNSTPIDLGSVTADAAGNIVGSFTVPANAEVGDHTVVAAGLSSGVVVSAAFTIQAAVIAPMPQPNPVTAVVAKPGDLAATGATSATLPLLVTAALLLAIGSALLISVRYRRSEQV